MGYVVNTTYTVSTHRHLDIYAYRSFCLLPNMGWKSKKLGFETSSESEYSSIYRSTETQPSVLGIILYKACALDSGYRLIFLQVYVMKYEYDM